MNPSQIDAAKMCKDTMKTDQERCKMLKRQACAFMKGKVNDPRQVSCAMKDIMKTQGEIKAKNTGCDTAGQIVKDPKNSAGALQGAMPGVAAGIGAGMVADKLGK